MTPYIIARQLYQYVPFMEDKPDTPKECSKEHIENMLSKILSGHVYGQRAQRWLGWIESSMCIAGALDYNEIKNLNLTAGIV